MSFADPSGGVNGGGIDKHDGNVILDRVNTAADAAFQPFVTFSQGYRFLAKGTDEHVKEVLRNHTGYIIAGS